MPIPCVYHGGCPSKQESSSKLRIVLAHQTGCKQVGRIFDVTWFGEQLELKPDLTKICCATIYYDRNTNKNTNELVKLEYQYGLSCHTVRNESFWSISPIIAHSNGIFDWETENLTFLAHQ